MENTFKFGLSWEQKSRPPKRSNDTSDTLGDFLKLPFPHFITFSSLQSLGLSTIGAGSCRQQPQSLMRNPQPNLATYQDAFHDTRATVMIVCVSSRAALMKLSEQHGSLPAQSQACRSTAGSNETTSEISLEACLDKCLTKASTGREARSCSTPQKLIFGRGSILEGCDDFDSFRACPLSIFDSPSREAGTHAHARHAYHD